MAKRKVTYIGVRSVYRFIDDVDAAWKGDDISDTNYLAVTSALKDVKKLIKQAVTRHILEEAREQRRKQGACDCDKCDAGSQGDCVVR